MKRRYSGSGLGAMFVALALATGACGSVETSATSSGPGAAAGTSSEADCTGLDFQNDPQNCGACGRTCVLPHGTATCSAGECGLGECDPGFANCDGAIETGCELAIDCAEGSACLTACGSTGNLACSDACAPSCAVPADSCNARDDDCDGACDQGAIAGCRVAVHRAYNGANGHLFTTDLAEAQAWGLEAQGFFYLYVDAAEDLRPLFRCGKGGTGNYFYSESNDCELTGAPLLTVGFIAPQPPAGEPPTCGSVPLYRIYLGGNNWHFYTTSLAERDAAIANGWVDQGLAGYVWQGP